VASEHARLALVFARGAVFTSHAVIVGAAPDAFQPAGAVAVFPSGCLETTIAIGCFTAVDTAVFAGLMLMKPVCAAGVAARAKGG